MGKPSMIGSVPRMTADELRAWRKLHKISQHGLATRLGVLHRTVEYWESDERGPPWYAVGLLHYLVCDQADETKERPGRR